MSQMVWNTQRPCTPIMVWNTRRPCTPKMVRNTPIHVHLKWWETHHVHVHPKWCETHPSTYTQNGVKHTTTSMYPLNGVKHTHPCTPKIVLNTFCLYLNHPKENWFILKKKCWFPYHLVICLILVECRRFWSFDVENYIWICLMVSFVCIYSRFFQVSGCGLSA